MERALDYVSKMNGPAPDPPETGAALGLYETAHMSTYKG